MSSPSSAPRGVLVAGLGALAALTSLWLPWYTIRIPEAFREALSGIGSGAAAGKAGKASGAANAAGEAFAGVFRGLAAVLPNEITGKGWQVMSGGDVALAVAAGAAMLLVLAVGGGLGSGVRIDRALAGRLIALAGLVVTLIAVYHVVSKPGADAGALSGIATVKFGIWVAAAGGLLMIAGGLTTGRETSPAPVAESLPAEEMPFAPPVDVAAAMPVAEPELYSAPDPFDVPAEPVSAHAGPGPASYAPLGTSGDDGTTVPDWTGFAPPDPQPQPEPQPVHATATQVAPEPSAPRAAGISVPPPGWTGAA